ncbi:MAG: PKD domain-containing protein [Methanobacteriota archaeon]|nr:MAG: PKD domain-containing protein [Euryarchaeota archaeon]
MELSRARSDMDANGVPDATSAAPLVDVVAVGVPVPDAGGPYTGHEGDTILLNATRSSDPDGDSLSFRWDFTGDGEFDTTWSPTPTVAARYTDDFSGAAVVEVSDGTHVATARAAVSIANSPPEARQLDAVAEASFRIEMAGEKWHNLTFTLASDAGVLASLNLIRRPGSPASQAATTGLVTFSLHDHVTATLAYTPDNDPVNGGPRGDNPAWIIVVFPDGHEVRIHHNFNVRHGSTWTWTEADLAAFFLHAGVTFRASLRDPGSDDLTATWDFGDGTSVTQMFFNNRVSPDPWQSQGGTAPFVKDVSIVHAYDPAGPFLVTLTVRDDEGGVATTTLVLSNA